MQLNNYEQINYKTYPINTKLYYKSKLYYDKMGEHNFDPIYYHNKQIDIHNHNVSNTVGINKIKKKMDGNRKLYDDTLMNMINMENRMKIDNKREQKQINPDIYKRYYDVDRETDFKHGLSSRFYSDDKEYKDMSEHCFDYISNEIQDPNHVVFPNPESTRLQNNKRLSSAERLPDRKILQ